MKVGILFSGGKDSALAAILLSPFAQIELATVSFGIVPNDAASVARVLGFPHVIIGLEAALATATVDAMIEDGYPNRGINHLHKTALERAAARYQVVADGTRRDDKAPLLNVREARSLEDRSGIDYVRPLLGYGRRAIDALADAHLEVTYGECISFDYEVELRRVMESSYGSEAVQAVFPQEHIQSRVTGRKSVVF
ncbi:MAG: alpha hydrolase [Halobacteriota archaeon]|jgi:predicted subunit of tRNA(5-methylaminomethyl-2-thiouridylate) methyltransferase